MSFLNTYRIRIILVPKALHNNYMSTINSVGAALFRFKP